jgi:sugar/nucleoside kinase (ribokinase family)
LSQKLLAAILADRNGIKLRTRDFIQASFYNRKMNELATVDLVGVGLNAIDVLIPLAEFPARGSKAWYTGSTVMPGGQAATTVIACQQWGLDTRYVGKVGDDDGGRLHRKTFTAAGVDAKLIVAPQAGSPQSLILVDGGGERTVLCRRDERVQLRPEDLNREWIVNARALHLDGCEIAAASLAAGWARQAGIPVIADLDEIYPGVDKLLENVDYLIVSRDFPARLTGEADLEKALGCIQERYGCSVTAATLGCDGVLAWDGSQFYMRYAYRVPVVDTTGAGDIFHAGFIYGLLQGWAIERQLDFACAAAALNCTAAGARGGIQSVAAIEELMANAARYDATGCVQSAG